MNRILSAPTAQLRAHPRADEIPVIEPAEYDALLLDIEERGIVTPLDVLPMRDASGRYPERPADAVECVPPGAAPKRPR